GSGRDLVNARRGGSSRNRRRVGLGKERDHDDRDAPDYRPERDLSGFDHLQGPRPDGTVEGRDAGGSRRGDRDDLPGPDDVAESGVHRRLADRGTAERALRAAEGPGAAAGDRAPRPGRDPEAGAADRRLPASVLRRDAAP